MTNRAITSASVVALGVGLLGLTVLQARQASVADGAAPASTPPRQRRVAAEGRVVTYPGAEVKVSAERPGRLVVVRFEEGDVVKRGALLATLDDAELVAALAETRARGLETAAELRLAEATLERRRDLVAKGVATVQDLDEAVRDVETAEARLATVHAEGARIEAQLEKTRVVAPIGGTVIARHADGGEMVQHGDPIATIADLARLRVDGEADEADAGALVEGARATITADGYPGLRFAGRIEEVADSVTLRKLKPQDPARPTDTRVIAVKVAFAEPVPLKLGTTVELAIEPAGP